MSRANHNATQQQLREALNTTLGKRPYRMWISNTEIRCTDECVEIIATTPFAAGWINDRYSAVIEDTAKLTYGRQVPVRITVEEQPSTLHEQPQRVRSAPPTVKRTNRRFLSFDEFVVGTCNELACAAAKQMTSDEGKTISPLFIHGACGVGKTHLLQAICKRAAKNSPGKVRYVTAEQFTNEFIASSRSGEFTRFRLRYRNLDLLAIDDVHFVKGKVKTQEELLHTIDAAGLKGSRLVLASDADPRHIRQLNRSLANRFIAGMIAEIQRPDRETRRAIIMRLTQKHGFELTEGAVNHLASHAVGSVREIEGKVTQLHATASLFLRNGTTAIGISAVEQLLRSTPTNTFPIRISDVLHVTASRSGLTVHDLKGPSRSKRVVFWRSVATFLGRELTHLSFPELAHAVGRKNHSTVHAAVKRIRKIVEQTDTSVCIADEQIDIREVIDQLTWSIRSRASGESARKPRNRKESDAD